jgi:uncharacterized protein
MARTGSIPQQVSADKALTNGQSYAGTVALSQLPRLKAVVARADAELEVELQAERDKRGAWLRGAIRGRIPLSCQRGLHEFEWPCELEVELRLVRTEAEETKLLKQYEPFLVQDDVLPLHDLVEEEVLLALPIVPRCDDPGCAARLG